MEVECVLRLQDWRISVLRASVPGRTRVQWPPLGSLGDCEVDIELLALKETQQQVIRRWHGANPALRLLLLL